MENVHQIEKTWIVKVPYHHQQLLQYSGSLEENVLRNSLTYEVHYYVPFYGRKADAEIA